MTEESQSWSKEDMLRLKASKDQLHLEELASTTAAAENRQHLDQHLEQHKCDFEETCASPHRLGPRSPKQRRPAGRRVASAAARHRLPAGAAWPAHSREYLHPIHSTVPQLVDRERLAVGETVAEMGGAETPSESEQSDGVVEDVGGDWREGGGLGGRKNASIQAFNVHHNVNKSAFERRRLPLKDEFRQMVHDNKSRSEALKTAHAAGKFRL